MARMVKLWGSIAEVPGGAIESALLPGEGASLLSLGSSAGRGVDEVRVIKHNTRGRNPKF